MRFILASIATLLFIGTALADVTVRTEDVDRSGDFAVFIVSATNDGREELQDVTAACTVFDANHDPIGTTRQVFALLKPDQTAAVEAQVKAPQGREPTSVICRLEH